MKKLYFLLLLLFGVSVCHCQERIEMKFENGIYTIPCTVNDLRLRFIFDTGASDVSISTTEAFFMLKNGYLKEEDFIDTQQCLLADGRIVENSVINIRELKIGSKTLTNIRACVMDELAAPLLLGQSAISLLGKWHIDSGYLYIDSSILVEEFCNDNLEWLYDCLIIEGLNLGTLEETAIAIREDKANREWLYRVSLDKGYDFGGFEEFEKFIGYGLDTLSYALGMDFGGSLAELTGGLEDDIDIKTFYKGVQDALAENAVIDREIAFAFLRKYFNEIAPQIALEKSQEYLSEIEKCYDVRKTPSGLLYEIIREGNLSRKAFKDTDQVRVMYEGKLKNGKIFDSSYERGEIITFTLNQVVEGFSEGLKLIGEGGEIKLWIPSELAYGSKAPKQIGPNQALFFSIELIEVIPCED